MAVEHSEDHPLTKRYEAGHQAWLDGRIEEARSIWLSLWREAVRTDDHYHACGAAHMLGVLDSTPMPEKLEWHLRSLEHADALGPHAARFYASIYSNVARSYQHLGDHRQAISYYWRALEHVDVLGDSDYGVSVRDSINQGLHRLGANRDERRLSVDADPLP